MATDGIDVRVDNLEAVRVCVPCLVPVCLCACAYGVRRCVSRCVCVCVVVWQRLKAKVESDSGFADTATQCVKLQRVFQHFNADKGECTLAELFRALVHVHTHM